MRCWMASTCGVEGIERSISVASVEVRTLFFITTIFVQNALFSRTD
jgi:hypothetical protein